jgi:hypothetical protein
MFSYQTAGALTLQVRRPVKQHFSLSKPLSATTRKRRPSLSAPLRGKGGNRHDNKAIPVAPSVGSAPDVRDAFGGKSIIRAPGHIIEQQIGSSEARSRSLWAVKKPFPHDAQANEPASLLLFVDLLPSYTSNRPSHR